jgi:hypothetical protein
MSHADVTITTSGEAMDDNEQIGVFNGTLSSPTAHSPTSGND